MPKGLSPTEAYWKSRCLAAERYIDDLVIPEISSKQISLLKKWLQIAGQEDQLKGE